VCGRDVVEGAEQLIGGGLRFDGVLGEQRVGLLAGEAQPVLLGVAAGNWAASARSSSSWART
jgi:hypothetical protein